MPLRTDLQNLGATHRKGKGGKYYWHGLTFKPVSTPAEITPADIAVDMGKQQKALERDIDYVEYLHKRKAELSSEIDNMYSIISELRADLAKLKREKESAFCETESEDEEVDFLMRR